MENTTYQLIKFNGSCILKIGCKLDLPASLYSQRVSPWAHIHGYLACICANKQWLDWSGYPFQ